jgi:hypothetical protein
MAISTCIPSPSSLSFIVLLISQEFLAAYSLFLWLSQPVLYMRMSSDLNSMSELLFFICSHLFMSHLQ